MSMYSLLLAAVTDTDGLHGLGAMMCFLSLALLWIFEK